MNASTLQARLPLVGFLFAVLAKFWLIWESEISDATDDPHEYMLQILYPINGGLAYGPGTGIVGRLFHDFGIPFRLGIEAGFLLAAVLVLRALFAWPWKSGLALALFVLVIFDPAPAELFSHLFSDQVWLIETMIGFSCIVLALQNESRPNWILLNVAAVSLGLSTLTRSVVIPLMVGLLVFGAACMALLFLQRRRSRNSPTFATLTISMVSLLLVIGLIYEGTCFYNQRVHGYDGISVIDSNEYKKFYFCLQSVGEPDGKQYFPVDQNRRNLIAQAGSNAKWLMAQIDTNSYLKQVGLEHYGTADIASGWLEFAIFTEAMQASGGDLQKCFAYLVTIEDEIEDANRRGIFTVRAIVPLPDSRLSIVVPAYPRALLTTIGQVAYEPPASLLIWNPTLQFSNPDFTTALTRGSIHESPARDQVWRALRGIYGCIYTPVLVYLYLLLFTGFNLILVTRFTRIAPVPLQWLAQQLFGFFFLVLIAWYALFDVSGWPALSRYLIFNHVMLPILLVYYICAIANLLGRDCKIG